MLEAAAHLGIALPIRPSSKVTPPPTVHPEPIHHNPKPKPKPKPSHHGGTTPSNNPTPTPKSTVPSQVTPTPPTPPPTAGFDLNSLFRIVQPMQHSTAGRTPLFVWGLPMWQGDALIAGRQNGTLRQAIDELAARGIVPTVLVGYPGTDSVADQLALAQTIADAGEPVYLVIPQANLIKSTAWQNSTVWATGPDTTQGGKVRNWPVLPLADPTIGANWVTQQVLPFKQAGINVAGVWYDDEDQPEPFNGIYEATLNSPQASSYYPPSVLANFTAFSTYVLNLRGQLTSQILVDPVHALFPNAVVSNFGSAISSASAPYQNVAGYVYPPFSAGDQDALMPSVYSLDVALEDFIQSGQQPTQQLADQIYFRQMLNSFSTAAANAQGKPLIPYLTATARPNAPAGFNLSMSDAAYRELLRQLWLRGANSMVLFGLGFPSVTADQTAAYQQIEDARGVYDEMLAFQPFLDHGTVMNLAGPTSSGIVWSGLQYGSQALIRTYSMTGQDQRITIHAFGIDFSVLAPTQGATFIIGQDGSVNRVG